MMTLAAAVAALPGDLRCDLRVVAADPAAADLDGLHGGAVDGLFADLHGPPGPPRRCACPVTALLLARGVLPAGLDLADHDRVARLVLAWIATQPEPVAGAVNQLIAAWDEVAWQLDERLTDPAAVERAMAERLRQVLAVGLAGGPA
jgi:hypothetical protein